MEFNQLLMFAEQATKMGKRFSEVIARMRELDSEVEEHRQRVQSYEKEEYVLKEKIKSILQEIATLATIRATSMGDIGCMTEDETKSLHGVLSKKVLSMPILVEGGYDSDTSHEDFEEAVEITDYSYRKWLRPPAKQSPFATNTDKDIEFMVLDCDFGTLTKSKINFDFLRSLNPGQIAEVDQSYLRLHGVNKEGNSVCCNVFSFLPYFYAIPFPTCFTEFHLPKFKAFLSSTLTEAILMDIESKAYHELVALSDPIIAIELIKQPDVHDGTRIFGFIPPFRPKSSPNLAILKITCRVPRFVWFASKILKKDEFGNQLDEETSWKFQTYEDSINHTIRFLTHLNIPGCSWVGIEPGNYFVRPAEEQLSHAQLEFDAVYTAIRTKPTETYIPPLRILSFDIEVLTLPPQFAVPRNGSQPILQIGNVLGGYSPRESNQNKEVMKAVFTWKSCDENPGIEIYSFETEAEMLENWRQFVLAFDPDIITGYNIKQFDFQYILDRQNRIYKKSGFTFLGRTKRVASRPRVIKDRTKAFNKYDTKTLNLNGRVMLDMLLVILRHNPVPIYTHTETSVGKFSLGEVSKRFLNQEKEDVDYREIFQLQMCGSDTRKKLATYCVQDAMLNYRLLILQNHSNDNTSSVDILEFYIHKARETGVPLKYLLTKSMDYHIYFERVRHAKNLRSMDDTPVKR